jgi:hypothetical protein
MKRPYAINASMATATLCVVMTTPIESAMPTIGELDAGRGRIWAASGPRGDAAQQVGAGVDGRESPIICAESEKRMRRW